MALQFKIFFGGKIMKFTKLMALVLVLVMLVSTFVACGGSTETETDPPATENDVPETDPKETETETDPPATETDPPCAHPENRRREMDRVNPTCDEDGYVDYLCRVCNEQWRETLPKTHTYGELKSIDGQYTRFTCVFCGDAYVVDANGATVADASAIAFPFFVTDFTGSDDLSDAFAGFADVKLVKTEFVGFVTNTVENNTYINIPTGTSSVAPNGYFEFSDVNNKLVAKDFSISFKVQLTEYPNADVALLTWKLGGTEYKLITLTGAGKLAVLGSNQSRALTDKGWDTVELCFDNETGDYYVYLNTEIFAKGNIGIAVAGKTESAIRFFEGVSQFEAYMDDIEIKFIDEAKTDACIHVYAESSKTAATCEADGKVTYKCSLCNATYDEVLPATGHTLGTATVVEATCTAPGTSTSRCSVCNKDIVESIPAKSHDVTWELVDGTPVQSCKKCSYTASYKTKGDALLALDFETDLATALNSQVVLAKNTSSIVEVDGNKVLDPKQVRLDDSANTVLYSPKYTMFTVRARFDENTLTAEKKESLFSFLNGYKGDEKVGQSVGWGITLAFIHNATDGSNWLSYTKNPGSSAEYISIEFGKWYDITILACGDSNMYYTFVDGVLLGTVTRYDYASDLFAGGCTLRIGEYGDSNVLYDDMYMFEIEAN